MHGMSNPTASWNLLQGRAACAMDDGQISFLGALFSRLVLEFFEGRCDCHSFANLSFHSHLTNPTTMGITDFSKALLKLIGLGLDHILSMLPAVASRFAEGYEKEISSKGGSSLDFVSLMSCRR